MPTLGFHQQVSIFTFDTMDWVDRITRRERGWTVYELRFLDFIYIYP